MTLPETLIAAAAVGMSILVAALGVSSVRNDLKRRQVWELLGLLDESLSAYHAATGAWPDDPGAPDPESAVFDARRPGNADAKLADDQDDGSASRVLMRLVGAPASRAVLERVPDVMRIRVRTPLARDEPGEPRPRLRLSWDEPGVTVQDAWGQPLRCLTANRHSAVERQAVAAHGGRPIFVSAGVDGRFGALHNLPAANDNLRSDERPRGGSISTLGPVN